MVAWLDEGTIAVVVIVVVHGCDIEAAMEGRERWGISSRPRAWRAGRLVKPPRTNPQPTHPCTRPPPRYEHRRQNDGKTAVERR